MSVLTAGSRDTAQPPDDGIPPTHLPELYAVTVRSSTPTLFHSLTPTMESSTLNMKKGCILYTQEWLLLVATKEMTCR